MQAIHQSYPESPSFTCVQCVRIQFCTVLCPVQVHVFTTTVKTEEFCQCKNPWGCTIYNHTHLCAFITHLVPSILQSLIYSPLVKFCLFKHLHKQDHVVRPNLKGWFFSVCVIPCIFTQVVVCIHCSFLFHGIEAPEFVKYLLSKGHFQILDYC